jgi:endonuclease/exonuclease/phosphatase family metal-dependent hydrolase
MRSPVIRIVPDLPVPGEAVLAEARRSGSAAAHGRFLDRIQAFHAIEGRPPARPAAWPKVLRLCAFNAERLKNPAGVRRLMDRAGAQVSLVSEADVGMARSGNAHTIRALTEASGEGYLYGVEFVELDLGDAREMREHAGERNACGFHGNAVVTALRIESALLIPLEESGFWFPGYEGAQRRIGGRIALAARLTGGPRPLWVVSVHLESKTDPEDRRAQMGNLLRALDSLAPDAACVIGGDFNTKALPRGEEERHLLLEAPERHEPLFADLRGAGFSWTASNLAQPTQRTGPSNKPNPPFGKLDWIFVRGVTAENPQVVPTVDEQGRALSDHEMLAVDLRF